MRRGFGARRPLADRSPAPDEPPASTTPALEAALLDGVHRGESEAAEALYRLLRPCIAHALHRVLGSSMEREDLTQITFERVIRSVALGEFSRSCGVKHWAMSIATYAAIDHLRAERLRRACFVQHGDVDALQARTPGDTEGAADARLQLLRLDAVLSRMKPVDARVLVLSIGLGYTVSEIASELGVSREATQSRLARARRRLMESRATLQRDLAD